MGELPGYFGCSVEVKSQGGGVGDYVFVWLANANAKILKRHSIKKRVRVGEVAVFPKMNAIVLMHVGQRDELAHPEVSWPEFTLAKFRVDNGECSILEESFAPHCFVSPPFRMFGAGSLNAYNARENWFSVTAPHGETSVWRVNEFGIQPIGTDMLLPSENAGGFTSTDVSPDLRLAATTITYEDNNSKNKNCVTYAWDIQSGEKLPFRYSAPCSVWVTIAFLDNDHLAIRLGDTYEVLNLQDFRIQKHSVKTSVEDRYPFRFIRVSPGVLIASHSSVDNLWNLEVERIVQSDVKEVSTEPPSEK